jgi:hypothetical protein
MKFPGAIRRQYDHWWRQRRDGPEFRDGDLKVRKQLKQECLERIVRAVQLVDQQDGVVARAERAKQRALEQVTGGVKLILGLTAAVGDRTQVHQLPRVVPLVKGGSGVDPLVALQSKQMTPGGSGKRLRDLGLPDARFPFQQERHGDFQREVESCGKALVRNVPLSA